jgi:hypothetical protein
VLQLNEPKGAEGIDEIRKAYEFTLDRLGQDINSGPLWLEYAHFLQARRGALWGATRRCGRPGGAFLVGGGIQGAVGCCGHCAVMWGRVCWRCCWSAAEQAGLAPARPGEGRGVMARWGWVGKL